MTNYNGFTNHETWDFMNNYGDVLQEWYDDDYAPNNPSIETVIQFVDTFIDEIFDEQLDGLDCFIKNITIRAIENIDKLQIAEHIME